MLSNFQEKHEGILESSRQILIVQGYQDLMLKQNDDNTILREGGFIQEVNFKTIRAVSIKETEIAKK